MSAVLLQLFLIFIPDSISKPYTIERSQGWIPITKEMAFNQFENFYDHYKLNERLNDMWNPSKVDEDKHVLKNNALIIANMNGDKITIDDVFINPPEKENIQETKENFSDKQDLPNSTENYNQSQTKKSSNFDVQDEAKKSIVERSLRRSKKYSEENLVEDINNLIVHEPISSPDESSKENLLSVKMKKDDIEGIRNTYEIYEDINATESFKTGESAVKENYGYVYNPPLLNTFKNQNNLTNSFFDILSKYDINSDDELPNYALSLQRNRSPVKLGLLNTGVPLRMPRKFNSLNRLSIDPMFAILLSNYGYYLPGFYGIQGNYRNLYGNLASNNIHNNRPFGFYKVFSDTDSSN